MSDTLRFIAILRNRGTAGYHSHEARKDGTTGNPAQRAKDATSAGHQVYKRREHIDRRTGCRYWLEGAQPSDAIAVAPNYDADGGGRSLGQAQGQRCGDLPSVSTSAAVSAEEMATVYDYTGTQPREYPVPVSELGVPKQMALEAA